MKYLSIRIFIQVNVCTGNLFWQYYDSSAILFGSNKSGVDSSLVLTFYVSHLCLGAYSQARDTVRGRGEEGKWVPCTLLLDPHFMSTILSRIFDQKSHACKPTNERLAHDRWVTDTLCTHHNTALYDIPSDINLLPATANSRRQCYYSRWRRVQRIIVYREIKVAFYFYWSSVAQIIPNLLAPNTTQLIHIF